MTRIDNTQHVHSTYDRHEVSNKPTESTDNAQLMVPASYAAVGGTFELLMLMLEASKAQKDGAREARTVAETSLSKAQAAQVDDIRTKATMQMVQGFASAGLSAGSAGMQLSAAGQSFRGKELDLKGQELSGRADQLSTVAGSEQNVSLLKSEALSSRQASIRFDNSATNYKLGAEMMNAGKEGINGVFSGAITNKDADATTNQNQADTLRRSAERLSSELDQIKGNEDKLISYARDIEAAKNRCTQIALQTR